MVLVALAMVAIIAMAAMSIDLVTLYLAREEAQRTADSAALAAARIISVSGITGTANPATDTRDWRAICGAAGGWATQAAQAVAAQNTIGGQLVTQVKVTYSDGSTFGASDCSSLTDVFAVNPMVTVQITPSITIPSFFSRVWGSTGNQISATATAEAFNPSQSSTHGIVTGSVTPVQPRCVKPWMVPNLEPGHCTIPGGTSCSPFVRLTDGEIQNPGISPGPGGTGSTGVIGERFTLFADCGAATPCVPVDSTPLVNVIDNGTNLYNGSPPPPRLNLEYLPGAAPAASVAVPSCASASIYQQAVTGCDQTTAYQCGQQVSAGGTNAIDLSENPGGLTGDTATGLACLLNPKTASLPLSGLDQLKTDNTPNPYPFVAIAGDANPLAISGTPITSSNSIMSLPIYDQSTTINPGTTNVTIVGFLQVFVNSVSPTDGSVTVTVLNVAGCGNAAANPPVFGSSPVPVRLITPLPPSQ